MKKIAVLIPCYNESVTIQKVVADFKAQLPEASIYVYDNNSTDETDRLAREAGAIIRYEPRQGKGNVVRSMFRDIEADCYLMVDGDDTYDPSSAPEMVQLVLEKQYDMVIGDRLSSTYFTENKRPFHNVGNKSVRFAINRLFKSKVKDIMTGYRAFSRSFVKACPISSQEFEVETEMTVHALDKNLKITSIPILYQDRPAGSFSKLHTIRDGVSVIFKIFDLFRIYRPMLFWSIISLIFIAVSTAFFVPVLVDYAVTGLVPRFPSLIASGIFLILSLLSFVCGVLSDMIKIKHRQLYELFLNMQTSIEKRAPDQEHSEPRE